MTRIQLEDYGYIDVKEGTYLPLNFNIQDLLDVKNTLSSFSKNITLVGSKNNNQILGNLFNVNISDSTFDRFKKVRCHILQEGVNVFEEGYFQLLSINKLDDRIEYTAQVKSNLMDFFSIIKDRKLEDLQISEPGDYHILNENVITNSFTNDYTDRWKYLTMFRESGTVFNMSDFRPSFFVRTLWDEIHKESGFDYEFPEMDDINFNKLIIPSNNKYDPDEEQIKEETLETLKDNFNFNNIPNVINGIFPGTANSYLDRGARKKKDYIINTNDVIKNPHNILDTLTQNITPVFYGEYEFNITFDYEYKINIVGGNSELKVDGDAEGLVNDWFFEIETSKIIGYIFGSPRYKKVITNSIKHIFNSGDTYSNGSHTIQTNNITLSANLELSPNEHIKDIRLCFRQAAVDGGNPIEQNNENGATFILLGNPNVGLPYNPSISMSDINFNLVPKLEYTYGTPIYLEQFLPKNIKQSEFIKSIIDMFKLMVIYDPNENKLIYKTRDKYYDDGKKVDWTKKLALDKNINIEWISNKQPKIYNLTYKEDKDFFNESYTKETLKKINKNLIYGQYEFTFRDEYNTGDDKMELIFSPTPISKNYNSNMVLPTINPSDNQDYNIRLLYDNHRSDGYFYIRRYGDDLTPIQNRYATGTHFDNVITPIIDLNFDRCAYYLYNSLENTTTNNLFNLYHKRYISQLQNGKIMTAYFNLSSIDILNFDLSDKIFILDSWWNINRIIDYNANSKQLTKVELISVDDGLTIKSKITIGGVEVGVGNATLGGGLNPSDPDVVGPISGVINDNINNGSNGIGAIDKNIINTPYSGNINGTGNIIGSLDGIFVGNVFGNNNMIESSAGIIVGNNKILDRPNTIIADEFQVGENQLPISNLINILTENDPMYINPITYIDLKDLKDNNILVPGVRYYITDRDIWIDALDTDKLSMECKRHFRIVKDDFYTPHTTTAGSMTQRYLGIYGQTYDRGSVPNSGDTIGSTSYYAIWGGRMWRRNNSGLDTPGASDETISGGWGLQSITSNTYYESKIFDIKYDFDEDLI